MASDVPRAVRPRRDFSLADWVADNTLRNPLRFLGLIFIAVLIFIAFRNISTGEYEADQFAAQVMERREPMIQGLVKLTRDNLSNLTPHPWYSFVYYSHPTVVERIRALEKVG